MVFLVTPRYDDRKIMKSIRIRSGLPVRIRKWHQFSQFRWRSTKVILADMKWNTWWYEILHTFNITILLISNVRNGLREMLQLEIISKWRKSSAFKQRSAVAKGGFLIKMAQNISEQICGWWGGDWKTWSVKAIF